MVSDNAYPRDARFLLRRAIKASLATLDKASATPYASLVGVASLADATPVVLISALARHTQNLEASARASLLVETVDAQGDGLAEGRATIMGEIVKATNATARRRFLARHPSAAGYADFADFAFYELRVSEVHIVQGFGRINTMAGRAFLLAAQIADTIDGLEESAIAHMNEDHGDAVRLYATRLCGAPDGQWRVVGVDPEGIDMTNGEALTRLTFPEPVNDAQGLRAMLARLAKEARAVAEQ